MDICEEYLPYDVTMFWEFFRWERRKKGHIYLQQFPNGKLYAGQTTRFADRMNDYSKNCGSSLHHKNALKKYGWSNVHVLSIECPVYMLDTIEIFLISYYNLTNPKNGYNKQSGGRKTYKVSKETRSIMSKLMIERLAINGHPMLGKTGVNSPLFGRKHTKETITKMKKPKKEETREKMRKSKSESHCENISKCQLGSKNHQAKPVMVFGNVYNCMQDASDSLRPIFKLKKKNFLKAWKSYKCYENDIIMLDKDVYYYMTSKWFYA